MPSEEPSAVVWKRSQGAPFSVEVREAAPVRVNLTLPTVLGVPPVIPTRMPWALPSDVMVAPSERVRVVVLPVIHAMDEICGTDDGVVVVHASVTGEFALFSSGRF